VGVRTYVGAGAGARARAGAGAGAGAQSCSKKERIWIQQFFSSKTLFRNFVNLNSYVEHRLPFPESG